MQRQQLHLVILGLITVLSAATPLHAQSDAAPSGAASAPAVPAEDPSLKDPKHIHTVVAQMPEFPGGQEAMMAFISENLTYPEAARSENLHGKVVVSFVVEPDGSRSSVKVVNGIHSTLDKEAIRVVNAMPKWIPGCYMKDVPARVLYTLPISFRP
ncbi:MAG: energy transducer TonB [Flavobacteriales bacterium]|nr:energy transducer TonB [Flavobacteriales bacterium]